MTESILDLAIGTGPDPDEFVRAAMEWHFNPETASAYWLRRARTLPFNPRTDVKGLADLALFPNVSNEMRDVRVEDLVPRGYGANPDIVGVYESGGTTGAPKRVVVLRDWWEAYLTWVQTDLDAKGFPYGANWLTVVPSGPHIAGETAVRMVADRGGIRFSVDMDPRWVKKLIVGGKAAEADAYAEHLVEQAALVLRTQDIGAMITTPPLLERIARRDDLVDLINEKVSHIIWGGAHMDADTRHLFRTEVFPGTRIHGAYGSTMILGGANERRGPGDDDSTVFDPPAPFTTFRVIDPGTGRPVGYGERGQVVMSHVSRNMLLPNNLERDMATRVKPLDGQAGDAVAGVAPVASIDDEAVIEGVY